MTNANTLANLLYSYTYQSDGVTVADVTNANANEKQWLALAITQALQEMHRVAPGLFKRRAGITLSAPITGTATVVNGATTITPVTLGVPNSGCTVRFGAQSLDNEIEWAGGAYQLRRPHDGPSGTLEATLWHDCWVSADGGAFENVLGDVLANGRPIVVARTLDEVELCRFRWGSDYGLGQPLMSRRRFAGYVLAVVLEEWASPFSNKIEMRLRFTPMPGAQTVIDANLQAAAPTISTANLLDPSVTFQVPASLDESIVVPIALKKWSLSPFFRTESARKGIDEQYAAALERLGSFRGHQEARASIRVSGY